jgi:ribosomal protein L20A (L18A)
LRQKWEIATKKTEENRDSWAVEKVYFLPLDGGG